MAAAMALGGFTGPEADTLGYAIRKKKSSVLRSMKDKFVTQAAERGVPPQTIDAVFKAFEPFERYGFNKAHATCYGLIAYQTAYLKANFTVEYMTSVLTAFRDNAEKVAAAVAECRRLGIDVRTPDVHRSHLGFTVEDEAIRFGLLAVKNVGEGAIESIIRAREEGGDFRSLTDFCTRVDLRLANRKVLESLARVGALNMLGHPAQILLGLDDALAAGQAAQRDRISGQTSLFEMGGDEAATLERPLPATPETPVRERLRWEKELMGLYLSDHPMGEVADRVGEYVTAYSGDLKDESLDGQRVVLGGIVTGIRTILTKARSTMSVVTLEDLQGTLEVVVFPKTYETTAGTWRDGAILLVAGRVDHRGDEASLLADSVWDWDTVAERGPEAFAREVGSLDKRSRRGPGGSNGNGGAGPSGGGRRPSETGGGPRPVEARATSPVRGAVAQDPARSPLPPIRPAEPLAAYSEPPDLASAADPGGSDGPEEAAAARRGALGRCPGGPGAVAAGRGSRRRGAQRAVHPRGGHRPRRVGDAGVQGAAPRASRCDSRRGPRAGTGRVRAADGAAWRGLRCGAGGRGSPSCRRRCDRHPAGLRSPFAPPRVSAAGGRGWRARSRAARGTRRGWR